MLGLRYFLLRRSGKLAVSLKLRGEREQVDLGALQLRRSGSGAGFQLRAALLIGGAASDSALGFQRQGVDGLAVLRYLAFNGVAALDTLGVLGFARAH